MKRHFSLTKLSTLALFALLITEGCKKSDTALNANPQSSNEPRSFGAVQDDPSKVAKVPLMVSRDFMNQQFIKLEAAQKARKNPTTNSGDATPPTVSITSPSNGSSVSGTVSISVSASDNVGVSSVSLSIDGAVVATTSASPYNFSWNSTSVADGVHTITAVANDAAGNTNSYAISVTKNTTTLTTTNLPSSYQLQMPPVQNQGSEGSCVAFAAGYAARSCEQFYRSGASSYSYSSNIFSPEYLFDQIKVDASCSGSSLLDALDFMRNTGICTWQTLAYSSTNGCTLTPTSTQNAEASNFKINNYSSIYSSDITGIKTLLTTGHPLMIVFATDQSFYDAGPGFIWSSYSSTNGPRHAVAICGYDDAKHAVKIINSWGTAWGDSGYTWIDYSFLPQLNSYVYTMSL